MFGREALFDPGSRVDQEGDGRVRDARAVRSSESQYALAPL